MSTTSILMLPDLLSDSRLLESQRRKFPNMRTPDWLAAKENESLFEYAGRCAEEWVTGSNASVDCQMPYVLGGVSFGGIVAMEMAFHLSHTGRSPKAVLLISSCRTWDALPEAIGRHLGWLNPFPAVVKRWLFARTTIGRIAKRERLRSAHARLLSSMLEQKDWEWLLRSTRMCKGWRRDSCDVARAPFPVHQIHGRLDRIIPAPSAKIATLLLDGGHFVCLTHVEAVNNWIEAIVRELEVSQTGARVAANGPQ